MLRDNKSPKCQTIEAHNCKPCSSNCTHSQRKGETWTRTTTSSKFQFSPLSLIHFMQSNRLHIRTPHKIQRPRSRSKLKFSLRFGSIHHDCTGHCRFNRHLERCKYNYFSIIVCIISVKFLESSTYTSQT